VTEPLCDDSSRTRFVLLVEDDAGVRDSMMKLLVNHGFKVLETASGDEGLSVAQNLNEAIEVAVVDMAMPTMWGDEFAEKLAVISPMTKFIFISGHSEDFLRIGGSLSGNEIFFPKPFSPKLLLEKIRELLGIETPFVAVATETSPAGEDVHAQHPHFAEILDLHIETDQRVD
jgi:DNA-binding response OmpR family regulator